MTPLARADVRARKRPLAIAAVSAFTLAWAYLVAQPIHAWAKTAWGAHPLGDAVLFRPGGYELMAWINEGPLPIGIALSSSFLLLLAGVLAGNVVFGALVASLGTEGGRRSDPVRAGFASFVPLAGASFLGGAIQLMVVALGTFGGSAAARFCEPRWGDAAGFTTRVAVVSVAVVLAALAGIVTDLARVRIAHGVATSDERIPALRRIGTAARGALGVFRRKLGRIVVEWAGRAFPSFALFLFGWWAGGLFGARGGWALFALFLIHQLVVVGRVAFRASWLASTLRLDE